MTRKFKCKIQNLTNSLDGHFVRHLSIFVLSDAGVDPLVRRNDADQFQSLIAVKKLVVRNSFRQRLALFQPEER